LAQTPWPPPAAAACRASSRARCCRVDRSGHKVRPELADVRRANARAASRARLTQTAEHAGPLTMQRQDTMYNVVPAGLFLKCCASLEHVGRTASSGLELNHRS
jgi:hypothetical protein